MRTASNPCLICGNQWRNSGSSSAAAKLANREKSNLIKSLNDYKHHLRIRPEKLASFVTVFTIDDKLARLSHTLAAHLANHLVASDSSSRTISPWICLGRPHPLATKALRNLNHPSMR
jgi:hypothetical protein